MAHSGRSGLIPAWAISRPQPRLAGHKPPPSPSRKAHPEDEGRTQPSCGVVRRVLPVSGGGFVLGCAHRVSVAFRRVTMTLAASNAGLVVARPCSTPAARGTRPKD